MWCLHVYYTFSMLAYLGCGITSQLSFHGRDIPVQLNKVFKEFYFVSERPTYINHWMHLCHLICCYFVFKTFWFHHKKCIKWLQLYTIHHRCMFDHFCVQISSKMARIWPKILCNFHKNFAENFLCTSLGHALISGDVINNSADF